MEYLLLQRSAEETFPGIWQCVAGEINPGETAVEAAVRELAEETGRRALRLYALDHVSTYYLHTSNEILMVPAFAAELETTSIALSTEHTDYRWLELEEARQLASWRPYRQALQAIPELLSKSAPRALAEIDLTNTKNSLNP